MNCRITWVGLLMLFVLCLMGTAITAAPASAGTTIIVNTTIDELNSDGDCSLREAIEAANTDTLVDACSAGNGADTIVFASNVTGTITIFPSSSPLPTITNSLSIIGPGMDILVVYLSRVGAVLSFGGSGQVYSLSGLNLTGLDASSTGISMGAGSLTIESVRIYGNISSGITNFFSGTVTVDSSVISDNNAPGGGGILNYGTFLLINSTISDNGAGFGGGGIYNTGTITILNSTVSGNSGGGFGSLGGGGIYNSGSLTLVNSTISSNSAPGSTANSGGGMHNRGTLTIASSTIVSNSTSGLGGGLHVISGTVTLQNTIIANNVAGGDCSVSGGTVTDKGYNLVEDNSCGFTGGSDPVLGPLEDNGGPTLTHALLLGSPAIDMGNPTGCTDGVGNLLVTDQRGLFRPADGDGNGIAVCDIGAYEFGAMAVRVLYLALIVRSP